MIAGVKFERQQTVSGSVGDFFQGVSVAEKATKVGTWSVRADMDIEPHLAVVLFGKLKNLLMRREGGDSRSSTGKIERVFNLLSVREVAHDQNDLRIFGPD